MPRILAEQILNKATRLPDIISRGPKLSLAVVYRFFLTGCPLACMTVQLS